MKRCFGSCLVALTMLSASPLVAQRAVPDIPFDVSTPLKLPANIYMGEPSGVATNSKGHIFVYTKNASIDVSTGTTQPFIRGGARLLEFDRNGNFVREIGQGLYGFVFGERVRIDSEDNIWAVDGGSHQVIKFNPEGQVVMVFGRNPGVLPPGPPPPPAPGDPVPFEGRGDGAGVLGDSFDRPSDVGFDGAGNVYVADGHGGHTNARIAKFDKDGRFIRTWGNRGDKPGQLLVPHAMAVDVKGNVYVADRPNKRVSVFDTDGNFKAQWLNFGDPLAICITPGPHQYLYISNSNSPLNYDGGEIYKVELNGTIVGKFGKAGTGPKDFTEVHTVDCQTENEVYLGQGVNWRVTKVTLRPGK